MTFNTGSDRKKSGRIISTLPPLACFYPFRGRRVATGVFIPLRPLRSSLKICCLLLCEQHISLELYPASQLLFAVAVDFPQKTNAVFIVLEFSYVVLLHLLVSFLLFILFLLFLLFRYRKYLIFYVD